MEIERKKVAIIGAGPAGIVSLRHLKDIAEVQVFESQEELGGQWNYHENTEEDTENLDKNAYFRMYGYLNGSMYDDLTTNIPKHCMSFKDFCLDKNVETVMSRKKVFKYIKDYVEHFNLNDYIKLRTTVKNVKIDETTGHKFKVTTVPTDINEGTEETFSYFDYVLVCNGRFCIPRMPNFEGESEFEGRIFHIHSFRKFKEEEFNDKNILVVGGSLSAIDIPRLIYKNKIISSRIKPKKIFIAIRSGVTIKFEKLFSEEIENNQIELKSCNVKRITKNSVVFEDGSEENIDTIIYTTGYNFCFPFLDKEDKIIEFDEGGDRGLYFGPLYKKMFSINHPNLIFVGQVGRILIIFYAFERQAQIIKQYINGDIILPSKEEMMESLNQELDENDKLSYSRSNFYLCNSQPGGYSEIDYNNDLIALNTLPVNTEYFPTISKIIYEIVNSVANKDKDAKTITFLNSPKLAEFDYFISSDTF